MFNFRFEVAKKDPLHLHELASLIKKQLAVDPLHVEKRCLYLLHLPRLEKLSHLPTTFFDIAAKVFTDPVSEVLLERDSEEACEEGMGLYFLEITFRPGVTDNTARAATEAWHLVDTEAAKLGTQIFSGSIYVLKFAQKLSNEQRQGLKEFASVYLYNPLLQKMELYASDEWSGNDRFEQVDIPLVKLATDHAVKTLSLKESLDYWKEQNIQNCWAMSDEELLHVRNHFNSASVQKQRSLMGLNVDPTDVEMEVLAQSWSEHCKHKIFAAKIEYDEKNIESNSKYRKLGKRSINSLYKTYIKGATHKLIEEGLDWCVSIFSDNAGIVRFDPKIDVCIKVETHNSPSALDPYGGALTGILGVNRDILGVGLGARPIANTDIFCFGPPDFNQALPVGVKHPKQIFSGVHKGVEDGGNQSGIPTVNGSINFDENFCGKPLVFCGTIGVIPQKNNEQMELSKKFAQSGDLIVMAGGAIGKDGIHGATMSSLALDEHSPVTAVQIGDPITQKRLMDFTLEARELNLFSAITDNGAGGLSSSIGEMSTLTGGARLDLALAHVKYPGLRPFELLVSESQERMSYAVPPQKIEAFLSLAKRRGVDAQVLGEFTDSGFFHVLYQGKTVLYLDLEFLHHSLPQLQLKAFWEGPKQPSFWCEKKYNSSSAHTFKEKILTLLARPNVASKEKWVRHYDHEVLAASVIKPFCGPHPTMGPSDAAVVWMYPHGGSESEAISVSHGMLPRWSHVDTYAMSMAAVDEAVRNAVCVGADPQKIALVDNFCWPDPLPGEKNPDHAHKLAQLVRSCAGLYEAAITYGLPLVSGKDSMKNDLTGKLPDEQAVKISVPPTLLVSALAQVQVSKAIDMSFKKPGDAIYLVGEMDLALAGSEFAQSYSLSEKQNILPHFDLEKNKKLYHCLYHSIQNGWIQSAHDVSDGGVACALAESALAGNLGAQLKLNSVDISDEFLFNETPGLIIITVATENEQKFLQQMSGLSVKKLGVVAENKAINIGADVLSLSELEHAWRSL